MTVWLRDAVGIEIFLGGARFVKLSSRRGKLELVDFGEKALERGLSAFDRVADGFGRVLSSARVHISFPGQTSHTCRLALPGGLLAAGPEVLKWELGQKLPSKKEEYELSVRSVGEKSFLGTAVRRKFLEPIAAPFAKKGAADLAFSHAAFGLAAVFFAAGHPAEGATALVHLGEDFSTVAVLDKGELTYVSEMPAPPGYLDSSEGDLAPTRELLQKSLMERFGVELSTLLHLLGFRAAQAGKIDSVYLGGPGAGVGSLAAALGELGGVRVGHLTTPLVPFPSEELPERWAVPLGLALSALSETEEPKTAAGFLSC
ncbi:MAG: hypothetical protein L0Z48_07700 [candidate division Zixibacteria bacterium]|nr:hypothetical protein [candidate division Zixibacteria bacterium]MCI0596413.1 hypothetical protein [candidate division Zixibacteria bacterium]